MMRISPAFALLLFVLHADAVVKTKSGDRLVRKRREWIIPPKPLTENVDYTHKEFIAKIRSDHETSHNIAYSLEGVGANKAPFHVFVVDPKTGLIRVTQVLDREFIHMYNLSGVAISTDLEKEVEKRIDIRIKVEDQNDNPPVFQTNIYDKVFELSATGTTVTKITATDADEEGNDNSKIAYSIIDQTPSHGMFTIKKDGSVVVAKDNLDREKADRYTLTVMGKDLDGKPGGNTGTGTVTIQVLDVNDNLPTLEKDEYEGSIQENTQGVEVMRLKAEDLDLENTDNWEAVYTIVTGNDDGYFSIRTDPVTNEGILMLDKAVDYEDVKNLELGLAVENKAPFVGQPGASTGVAVGIGGGAPGASGTGTGNGGGGGAPGATGASIGSGPSGGGGAPGATGASVGSGSSGGGGVKSPKTYPIKITVTNEPEGPRFDPKVKTIPISEGGKSVNINEVIARYPAIDGDTGKPAEKVRYAKGHDPGNWLTIDPKTAEIKLNKMPDRESDLLVDGTYYTEVLCITEDMPAKTATGTIAIAVEDFNDHCPVLTSDHVMMCTNADTVIVNAKDEDLHPNGPPFDFVIIPDGTKGKWQVEHLNDTAATLRAQETMWPGLYEVEFQVQDKQGQACPEPQKVKVHVCTCENGVTCGERGSSGQIKKDAEFGPAAIGLLFLGLLLLLLIPLLLLFCKCGGAGGLPGGFTEMPFDTKSHLINYRTEGQGENTEVPLLNMPTEISQGIIQGNVDPGFAMAPMAGLGYQQSVTDGVYVSNGIYQNGYDACQGGAWGTMNHGNSSVFQSDYGGRESRLVGGVYDGMALPDHFLKQYYTQKANSANENLGTKDGLLVYDYEGQGSAAGSVSSGLLESDNDLQFLDDLGLKFKTLAEVCGGEKITTEVKQVFTPPPSAPISTQRSVSSVVTAQQQPPPPQLQPTVQTGQTVVRETSAHSQMVKESTSSVSEGMTTMREGMTTMREGMTTVRAGMTNQGQMLLLPQQQPVYYTTTPVMQPMHYVVQPQVQNTVLLAEAPATNLQGMVLVNGTQTGATQGVLVQGQTVMSSGQAQGPGMMLVESSGVQGAGGNLIQTGNLPSSQTMVVMEGKVPAGTMKVLKGSQTCLVQGGTLPAGGLSGSQRVLVVGGQVAQEAGGLSRKSDISGSQKILYSKSNTIAGSKSSIVSSSTTTVSTSPTYSKVEKFTQ